MRSILYVVLAAAVCPAQIAVTVDAAAIREPMDLGRYALGQGGLSDDPMFDEHVEAIRALKVKIVRLFVQEYFDVYPKAGVYHWRTLDRSIDAILATGAKPLMSICIKPRTLFPVIDQDQVHPTSYAQWEELIYRMVRHYNVERRAGIQYWEVFNEPDIGEDGGCPSRFKANDYNRYYEHTVRAIRRADPKAKVGGPALASWQSPLLKSLVEHCVGSKTPLDFVSWHIYHSDPAAIRKTIEGVKELLKAYPSLRAETVLDEWNMSLRQPRLEPGYQPAFTIETIHQMREAGLDLAAYYHIRDYHVSQEQFGRFMSRRGLLNMVNWWNLTPQHDGLFDFQGVMRPAYFAFKMLSRLAGNRVEAQANPPGVRVMASWDEDQQMVHALIWNFSVQPPPAREVALHVRNLQGKRWTYRRLMLDADTASNQENDRMYPARTDYLQDITEVKDTFRLPPYGVTLVALRRTM